MTNSFGVLAPPLAVAVDNQPGRPACRRTSRCRRRAARETFGVLTARILPNRTNGTSRNLGEPTETIVGNAGGGLGLLLAGCRPSAEGLRFGQPGVATADRDRQPDPRHAHGGRHDQAQRIDR